MLPKKHRLTAHEIVELRSHSLKKVYAGDLAVFALPNDSFLKVGIIVSKKNFKKAVDRNKVKRQLYHLIRSTLPLTPSWTLLLLPKATFIKLSPLEQQKQVSHLLEQLRVSSSR